MAEQAQTPQDVKSGQGNAGAVSTQGKSDTPQSGQQGIGGGQPQDDLSTVVPQKFLKVDPQTGKREVDIKAWAKAWQDIEVAKSRFANEAYELKRQLQELQKTQQLPPQPTVSSGEQELPSEPELLIDMSPQQLQQMIQRQIQDGIKAGLQPLYQQQIEQQQKEALSYLSGQYNSDETLKTLYNNEQLFQEEIKRVILDHDLDKLTISPKQTIDLAIKTLKGEKMNEILEYGKIKGQEEITRNQQKVNDAFVEGAGTEVNPEAVELTERDKHLLQFKGWDEKKLKQAKARHLQRKKAKGGAK